MEARRTNPWLWPLIAILLVLGGVALVWALLMPATGAYYGGYYGMMGSLGGWGVAMMLVPLAVFTLLILVIVGAAGPHEAPMAYAPAPPPAVPPPTAFEILNARYARGEISRDEYLRIRGDLTGGRGDRP